MIKKDFKLQSGIRINNKLSARGQEMAKEMFDHFDEDKDGLWTLTDFRTMLAARSGFSQFIHELEYSHLEAWKMFMKDIGFGLNARGMLDSDTFVKYRCSSLNHNLHSSDQVKKSSFCFHFDIY